MIFSYTQISNYLRCPRNYRYRYLDGWKEKETRAAMIFGRCFEKALASLFLQQDCTATLFREWGSFRDAPLEYKNGESWDDLVHQGMSLLEQFVRQDRVRIEEPQQNLQRKMVRHLPKGHEFVAYIDAIGKLDGRHCVIDWKTTASRYPEDPAGLLSLDLQLICYSWICGISEVALVVFVRKRVSEVQYLTTTISGLQWQEFGRLVESTVGQITSGEFPAHSGIRFPQNSCLSCANLGLCLNDQQLVDANLIRIPGASELDWIDELVE